MLRLVTILLFASSFSFGQENEIMYRITDREDDENCGYVNANGDTLISFGECFACFSDSLKYAIVYKASENGSGFPALNSKGEVIFRVFIYDNGPDYIEDGTFRIINDGKIGYATAAGEIIIPPKYEAAWPFENGKAQVSIHATKEQDGEHGFWTNADWFFIDKEGKRIAE
ncbi:MAG: WG repeat-containing protein [Crocinitomicaceae bacterium]|nr:WG repeat-containing protein [Crocinitomicaceae bacterium]